MTRPDIDTIEARAEAATKGPWELGKTITCGETCSESTCWHYFDKQAEIFPPLGESGPVAVAAESSEPNGPFIAHARTDLPALCQYVRELEAQIERLGARWYDPRHGEGP